MSGDKAPPKVLERADDFELLVGVAARLNRVCSMLLADLDAPLTFRQYRTLTRVIGGFTSLRQLAARGNLSIPTVSENVDGLVKRGLMVTRPSSADRRAITLHVTPEGAQAAAAGDLALRDFVGSLLVEFSDDQRSELSGALQSIYEAATVYFTEHLGLTAP